jgi:hypothetical protein
LSAFWSLSSASCPLARASVSALTSNTRTNW